MFGKKLFGVTRINAVVGKLEAVKAELLAGVTEVDELLQANRAIQDRLRAENTVLGAGRNQAIKLAKNIDELLS